MFDFLRKKEPRVIEISKRKKYILEIPDATPENVKWTGKMISKWHKKKNQPIMIIGKDLVLKLVD